MRNKWSWQKFQQALGFGCKTATEQKTNVVDKDDWIIMPPEETEEDLIPAFKRNIDRLEKAGVLEPGKPIEEQVLVRKRRNGGWDILTRAVCWAEDERGRITFENSYNHSRTAVDLSDETDSFLPYQEAQRCYALEEIRESLEKSLSSAERLPPPSMFKGLEKPYRLLAIDTFTVDAPYSMMNWELFLEECPARIHPNRDYHLLLKVYENLDWIEHGWDGPFIIVQDKAVGVVTKNKPIEVLAFLAEVQVQLNAFAQVPYLTEPYNHRGLAENFRERLEMLKERFR